jgi:hypothetical protein
MHNKYSLSTYLSGEKDREKQRLEAIRHALSTATIPVPDELREAVASLFVTEAMEVLRAHPGFDLEYKLRSLRTTLQLFDQAYLDLMEALAAFDTFSRRPEFNYRSHRDEHSHIERRVRKEIFAFSELAHSLQDHSRRVKSQWENPAIDLRIPECFGTDGLHDFVCGLRSALHHMLMVDADWEIRDSGAAATSHYMFRKDELLAANPGWNAGARRYFERCGEVIDVGVLAQAYHPRVHSFYDTLLREAELGPPPDVADYRHCWNAHWQQSARMTWSFLLAEYLKRNIDPYGYLERYLTPVELEAARRLPHRSREQVDFIIQAVDEFSACDGNLRATIYRLFGVTAGTAA